MNAFYFGTGYLISYSGTGFPRFQPAPTGHSIEPWLEGDLTEMHACGLWFNTLMGEPGVLANRSSLAPKRGHSRQVKWISIAYFLRKNNLSVRFRNDCSWCIENLNTGKKKNSNPFSFQSRCMSSQLYVF